MSDIFDKIASDFLSEKKQPSPYLTQPLRTRYDYGELNKTSADFNDLDDDNDGRISPDDWEGGFDMIDEDGSGFISEEEWGNPHFSKIDQDDDGLISRAEWEDAFEELDDDDDGFISENEFYSRKASDRFVDDAMELDDLDEDDIVIEEEDEEAIIDDLTDIIEDEVEKELDARSRFVNASEFLAGGHRGGSYMSLSNIREMAEFLDTLFDQVHDGEELDDWVEDKITRAHAILSDLHRYFAFGDGYHEHDDEEEDF